MSPLNLLRRVMALFLEIRRYCWKEARPCGNLIDGLFLVGLVGCGVPLMEL